MKTEELLIGDWVSITESDDFHGYIGKVVIINSETGYITVHIPDMHLHDVFVEDLQPIQLTSEILEKNGFKHLQDTYLFNITTNHFGVNLWLEIGPDSWIENNKIYVNSLKEDFNHSMLTVMTCKYVHEFQHLLKFYEIKKDIVL